jgi:hypothetical protein
MTTRDWYFIGIVVLGALVSAWASYSWGYYAGADHEHARAWGDGYRRGYRVGMRKATDDVFATHCRLCGKEWPDCTCNLYDDGGDDDDIERCPECGGNWPECEGIRDDGGLGCTRDGKTNVGWMVARRRGGR